MQRDVGYALVCKLLPFYEEVRSAVSVAQHMIYYKHIVHARNTMERNRDFIEYMLIGACLIIGVVMGWLS